jgi:hypothetical protein
MKIDNDVEPLLREALSAAVKADGRRFAQALQAFPNDESLAHGVAVAMAVGLYVLHDVFGHRPTTEELHEVARKLVAMETWAEVNAEDVVAAVTAAFDGRRGDEVLPPEKVLVLPLIVAAYLLSAGRAENEQWWEYLDRAEAAIER